MKILIAIDQSKTAMHMQEIAKKLPFINAEFTIVTVINEMKFSKEEVGPVLTDKITTYHHELRSDAKKLLAEAQNNLSTTLKIDTTEILTGDPRESIAEFANARHFDLIMVGSADTNKLLKFLLGSVSKSVVETSKAPVLVCKPELTGECNLPLLSIGLAFDNTASSRNACKVISMFTDKQVKSINLLNYCEIAPQIQAGFGFPRMGDFPEYDSRIQSNLEAGEQLLKQISPNITIYKNAVYGVGDIAADLIEKAKQENLNLLVVGNHSKNTLDKFILGSVSESILAQTHTLCLVVK